MSKTSQLALGQARNEMLDFLNSNSSRSQPPRFTKVGRYLATWRNKNMIQINVLNAL